MRAAARTSPQVDLARAERDAAAADVQDVASTRRPQLSAFARTQAGDTGLTGDGFENQIGLRASQRLLDFGASRFDRAAAAADLDARRFDLATTELNAARTAATLALGVLEVSERLEATQARAAYFARQLEVTEAILETGGATRSDVAEIAARLAEAEADRLELQFQDRRLRRQLRTETGLDASPCASVETEMQDLFPQNQLAPERALNSNPTAAALRKTLDGVAAREKRARRNRLPAIDLVAIVSYVDDGFDKDWRLRDRIGVDVSVPLLSGRALNAERSRAAARTAAARSELTEFSRRVREQADILYQSILSLNAQIARRRAVVDRKSEQFAAAEEEFEAGLKILPELVEDRLELETARIALVSARYDLYTARLDLAALSGALLDDGA